MHPQHSCICTSNYSFCSCHYNCSVYNSSHSSQGCNVTWTDWSNSMPRSRGLPCGFVGRWVTMSGALSEAFCFAFFFYYFCRYLDLRLLATVLGTVKCLVTLAGLFSVTYLPTLLCLQGYSRCRLLTRGALCLLPTFVCLSLRAHLTHSLPVLSLFWVCRTSAQVLPSANTSAGPLRLQHIPLDDALLRILRI